MITVRRNRPWGLPIIVAGSLVLGITLFRAFIVRTPLLLVLVASFVAGLLALLLGRQLLRSRKPVGVLVTALSVLIPLSIGTGAGLLLAWLIGRCFVMGWAAGLWAGGAAVVILAALFMFLPWTMPGRWVQRGATAAFGQSFAPGTAGWRAVHSESVTAPDGSCIEGWGLGSWFRRLQIISTAEPPPKADEPRPPTPLNYKNPSATCDMVMKGGITSGVFYPLAACELATVYELKNVGGTSAGAIAAAAAAAAEYGRPDGYKELEALPRFLATGTNLVDLFQPQPGTRRLFRLMTAGMGHASSPVKAGKILWALTRSPALIAMALGAAPGAYLLWRSLRSTGCAPLIWAAGLPVALAGLLVGLLSWLALQARNIPRNRFGLCSGYSEPDAPKRALTNWLTDELEKLAGRCGEGARTQPLTFGHLWLKRQPDFHEGEPNYEKDSRELSAARRKPEDRRINLETMTTNLTQQRPYRFPNISEEREDRPEKKEDRWFFHPDEFRQLFPEEVVAWMERNPRQTKATEVLLIRKLLEPLKPLPPPSRIPVVVAARFSLSFPMLLSAVPLYQPDYGRRATQDAIEKWGAWIEEGDWIPRLKGKLPWTKKVEGKWQKRKEAFECDGLAFVAERSWFSDGGISSNFPIHFFDGLIPSRPTFAINLRRFHPDYPQNPMDERKNVYMPLTPQGGLLETLSPLSTRGGLGAIGGFLSAIVETARNWHDSVAMRVPGHRDRIVHISHTKQEGGMNLRMPEDVVTALTTRGRMAGERLRVRFSQHPATWDPEESGYEPATPGWEPIAEDRRLGWDYQRWTRLRTAIAVLEEALPAFERAYAEPQPPYQSGGPPGFPLSYAGLIERPYGSLPYWYAIKAEQRGRLRGVIEDMQTLVDDWMKPLATTRLAWDAPGPKSEVRITPQV
jgi:hypothetical protein